MLRKKFNDLNSSVSLKTIKVRLWWGELKADENAMEVIQVVMLIAVGVIAIAAIWAGINGLLEDWWEMIVGSSKGEGGPNLPTS